jgi:SAM-dependent methyltransferase
VKTIGRFEPRRRRARTTDGEENAVAADYRSKFASPEAAARYDLVEYKEKSYAAALWNIEQQILLAELHLTRRRIGHIDYLDFACGSGRILSLLEPHVDSATGVDVSQDMLNIARDRTGGARLIRTDITVDVEPMPTKYDFITAFRFLLNAEPELRHAAVGALARRLRDRNSRLIINNHGNFYSHRMLMWPYHQFKWMSAAQPMPRYLVRAQVQVLFDSAGLEIVAMHGIGFLGAKAHKLLPYKYSLWLESRFADAPILRNIGVNQIFVVRLR